MVVELPAGVPMLYPSALFYHFNADIAGKSFFFFTLLTMVITIADFDLVAAGRGSLVWFNQASMVQSAELGHLSIEAARKAGLQTTSTNFQADADTYFSPAAPLASLLYPN